MESQHTSFWMKTNYRIPRLEVLRIGVSIPAQFNGFILLCKMLSEMSDCLSSRVSKRSVLFLSYKWEKMQL